METRPAKNVTFQDENRNQEIVEPLARRDWVGIGLWTTVQFLLWTALTCIFFFLVPEFQNLLEEFEIGTNWITESLFVVAKFLRKHWPLFLCAAPILIVTDASLLFVARSKTECRTPIRLIRFFPPVVVTLWIAIGIGLPALAFL